MKSLKLRWEGIRPLIMHNGLLVDPTYPFTVSIKEITSKGSKNLTQDDHETRDRLEWEGGLYWDEEVGPYIPSDNIERCLQKGAMKSRKGKDVQAAVFVTDDIVPLVYEGPRTMDDLYADPYFIIRKRVVLGRVAIIRVRPRFPIPWSIDFTVDYDETVVDAKTIVKASVDAGSLCGLGDWRPKYGRFETAA